MDPLLDDSIFFAKRLASLRRPVRLQVLDDLPHGILNLAPIPGNNCNMKKVKLW
jgi:hormone-sensitive lipase